MDIGYGLGILPIIGGYSQLYFCYLSRFYVLRHRGYHIFFQSSIAGVVLSILAYGMLILLNPSLMIIDDLKISLIPEDPYTVATIAILSVMLGLLLPYLINFFLHLMNLFSGEDIILKTWLKAAMKHGKFIEVLTVEAMKEEELVELTLKSRDSYIGFAARISSLNVDDPDIELVPVLSGYRNKDTLEWIPTMDYSSDVFETRRVVVIPRSEIVTAQNFIPIVPDDDEGDDGGDQADGPA